VSLGVVKRAVLAAWVKVCRKREAQSTDRQSCSRIRDPKNEEVVEQAWCLQQAQSHLDHA
jgi:hypothetical protein